MASRKRKVLTLEDKVKIISAIEGGKKKADVCREFNLVNSTVCSIWKEREKILNAFEENGSKIKRIRKPVRDDLDEMLLKWFKQQRSANVPLNGPLLMAKAEEFAKLSNGEEFVCSSGWIDRFKLRHNIDFAKMCGEAKSVNLETTKEWLSTVWPKVREGYVDSEIFNADETGLFFKLTPDKTLKFKDEKCIGGKLSKDRITVLVCANMNGTEKKTLTVIGKSRNPRCFKNVKSFPVQYHANKKAWMTSDLFEAELRRWDRELQRENKKVLLLVDNCPSHPKMKNLQKIKLVFLPANCTSALQPLDQGVIRSLKCNYRKLVLLKIIECIEKKKDCAITLLDAVRFLGKAWRRVTKKTISNCFRHAGFNSLEHETTDAVNDDDDLPLSQWIQRVNQNNVAQLDNLDDFLHVDDNVLTTEAQTDFEILQGINYDSNTLSADDDDEEESNEMKEEVPSVKDALQAIQQLSRFYEARETDKRILQEIAHIEDNLEHISWCSAAKQKKITNFFLPN